MYLRYRVTTKGPGLPCKGPLRLQFAAWVCDRQRARVRGGPEPAGEAVRDQRTQGGRKRKASIPGACTPGPEDRVRRPCPALFFLLHPRMLLADTALPRVTPTQITVPSPGPQGFQAVNPTGSHCVSETTRVGQAGLAELGGASCILNKVLARLGSTPGFLQVLKLLHTPESSGGLVKADSGASDSKGP